MSKICLCGKNRFCAPITLLLPWFPAQHVLTHMAVSAHIRASLMFSCVVDVSGYIFSWRRKSLIIKYNRGDMLQRTFMKRCSRFYGSLVPSLDRDNSQSLLVLLLNVLPFKWPWAGTKRIHGDAALCPEKQLRLRVTIHFFFGVLFFYDSVGILKWWRSVI